MGLSLSTPIPKGVDKISNLPDAVLCHILSFLPTKNAVRTSVLSTRWKYLWVSVSSLDFELHPWKNYFDRRYFDGFKEPIISFTNFMDRLLVLRNNSMIQKFRFSYYGECEISRLYSWLCAILTCNVQELDLELRRRGLGKLPLSIFHCKTLVVLKLRGEFVLNAPFDVSLPSLKTLYLHSIIYLNDASIEKFLPSCPVLEELNIDRPKWDNVWNFKISVPSLKKLTFIFDIPEDELYHQSGSEYNETDSVYKVSVDVPNLEYLKLVDYMSDIISVNQLRSVVEARVTIKVSLEYWDWKEECSYGNRAYELLKSISNVKRLSLSGYTLESLSVASEANLPTFCNLVHLEIGFDSLCGPVLLPDLLERSPNLEVIVLPEGITWAGKQLRDLGIYLEYYWKPPLYVPECLLLSLKTVEIYEFDGKEEELKLVKYLLKNAMVLEKMTISCHCWPSCDDYFSFRDELEQYPRGSTACELIVYTSPY